MFMVFEGWFQCRGTEVRQAVRCPQSPGEQISVTQRPRLSPVACCLCAVLSADGRLWAP